jgi:hypothetical protein
MHTQPKGCPLTQHLVEGPQKSLQIPAPTSQVMQMGHSASV